MVIILGPGNQGNDVPTWNVGLNSWVSQPVTGVPGSAGPSGPKGLTGNTGATGSQGPIGLTGNVGPSGVQGPIGLTGSQGSQGVAGPTGTSGILSSYVADFNVSGTLTGNTLTQYWVNRLSLDRFDNTGAVGLVLTSSGSTQNTFWGSPTSGPPGPTGPAGVQGPTGSIGSTGAIGGPGPSGAQGVQGSAGPIGPTGGTQAFAASSFIILPSGSLTIAKNGTTGVTDFSNSDPYVVISGTIAALPNGGQITIRDGTYSLSAPIVFNNGNYYTKQWLLEGEGWTTILNQSNSNADAIQITNGTNVYLRNLRITLGANARYGVYGISGGSDNVQSWRRGGIDNVSVFGGGASSIMMYLQDAYQITGNNVRLSPTTAGGWGLKLEAVDTGGLWGNLAFNGLRVDHVGGGAVDLLGGNAGSIQALVMVTINDLFTSNYGSATGAYGMRLTGKVKWCRFLASDIEGNQYGVYVDGADASHVADDNSWYGGYITGGTGGASVWLGSRAGFQKFYDVFLDSAGYNIHDYGSGITGPNFFTNPEFGQAPTFDFLSTLPRMTGWGLEAKSTATITAGNTSTAVSHGLWATPTTVEVTPTTDTYGKHWWRDTLGASTFTIRLDTACASGTTFDWRARYTG